MHIVRSHICKQGTTGTRLGSETFCQKNTFSPCLLVATFTLRHHAQDTDPRRKVHPRHADKIGCSNHHCMSYMRLVNDPVHPHLWLLLQSIPVALLAGWIVLLGDGSNIATCIFQSIDLNSLQPSARDTCCKALQGRCCPCVTCLKQKKLSSDVGVERW